jgi:hypothetical protein
MLATMTPWWHFWKIFLESEKLSSNQLKREFGYSFYLSISNTFLYFFLYRCFPHIVNLACKAALAAITDLSHAGDNAQEYEPNYYQRDVIATVRSLVNAVSEY